MYVSFFLSRLFCTSCLFLNIQYTVLQGVPMQTVKSNLDQTERKNAINFNFKMDFVQGRLGIYAWMISKVPSWPLLASVTSNFTIHIFT